jgi:hypothetical protein
MGTVRYPGIMSLRKFPSYDADCYPCISVASFMESCILQLKPIVDTDLRHCVLKCGDGNDFTCYIRKSFTYHKTVAVP